MTLDTGWLMRWQPAHETHSIERVAISLMLSEPLPTKVWQRLLDDAGRHLTSLGFHPAPDRVGAANAPVAAGGHIQIAEFMIGPNGVSFAPSAPSGVPNARTFQKLVDGQVQSQIILMRTGVSLSVDYYDRWTSFREMLMGAIEGIINVFVENSDIQTAKIEYWDRFIFNGDVGETNFTELLNYESPYVPEFSSISSNLWHSHIGYFDAPESSAQRLINLNLDVVDVSAPQAADLLPGVVEPRRSLGIYTMAQDTLHQGERAASIQGIGATLDEMHTTLNRLLSAIITSDAAKRISLES